MTGILYRGNRAGGPGTGEVEIYLAGLGSKADQRKPLPPRYDLANHSPDGFEWGYGGSGPAQLALAICAHALEDDQLAQMIYQDFKWAWIAPLKGDVWSMERDWVREQCKALAEASPSVQRQRLWDFGDSIGVEPGTGQVRERPWPVLSAAERVVLQLETFLRNGTVLSIAPSSRMAELIRDAAWALQPERGQP